MVLPPEIRASFQNFARGFSSAENAFFSSGLSRGLDFCWNA
jgi:hypothetical protein